MFWADRVVEDIKRVYAKEIAAGKPVVIRDEKTISGRVHIGSMRGVAIHGIIAEILAEQAIPHTFRYELNDFDPMDGLPVYLPETTFRPYMGRTLKDVPSPETGFSSYTDYFGQEYQRAIAKAAFAPEYYLGSEVYYSGRMNDAIRMALTHADQIKQIYREVSGSQKEDTWLPLNVVCEECGKVSTTRVTDFDGETVGYECKDLDWTPGCGKTGRVSPFDGRAKLPWKVEWAAKFKVHGVMVEGAGKDHSTRGGSREVANRICREVFEYEPPYDVPYEFFLIEGKKMSSSKGQGSAAIDIADLLPPRIFRLTLLGKDLNQQINFKPEGDTLPILYDQYDKLAESFWAGVQDDYARLFSLVHPAAECASIPTRFLPRFSTLSYLVQMPHLKVEEEVQTMKGAPLTTLDREELDERVQTALFWLGTYAPDDFKFEIQKTLPNAAKNFTEEQRLALANIRQFLQGHPDADGQAIHTQLHELRKQSGLEAKDFFGALYIAILGKPSGPKAGWFLSVLERDFLLNRLEEASK